jgi:hypothetical protein
MGQKFTAKCNTCKLPRKKTYIVGGLKFIWGTGSKARILDEVKILSILSLQKHKILMAFQRHSSGATSRKHQNKTALDFKFHLVWLLTMEES